MEDFQGCAVMNYADLEPKCTRVLDNTFAASVAIVVARAAFSSDIKAWSDAFIADCVALAALDEAAWAFAAAYSALPVAFRASFSADVADLEADAALPAADT